MVHIMHDKLMSVNCCDIQARGIGANNRQINHNIKTEDMRLIAINCFFLNNKLGIFVISATVLQRHGT